MQKSKFQNKRTFRRFKEEKANPEADEVFFENLARIILFTLVFLMILCMSKMSEPSFFKMQKLYQEAMQKDYSLSEVQETMKQFCTPIFKKGKSAFHSVYRKEDALFGLGGQSNLSIAENCTFSPIYITADLHKPLKEYRVNSPFGYRIHPITRQLGFHKGVDLFSERNAPIYAALDGVVSISKFSKWKGNYIVLSHGNDLETCYCHCEKLLYQEGDVIKRGEPIATVGSTGDSTGPHLHFEIKYKGVYYDPKWLFT